MQKTLRAITMSETDIFMEDYREAHARCPKCGGNKNEQTLAGGCVNMDNPEEYKDTNRSYCRDCEHMCIVHDRVPL